MFAHLTARLRPTVRVATRVLVVVGWMIATLKGAWGSAVGAGRDWASPASWGFVLACFVALTALHFAVLVAVNLLVFGRIVEYRIWFELIPLSVFGLGAVLLESDTQPPRLGPPGTAQD